MLVLITAGDPSGDAHAARLMAEFRLNVPTVKFIGFGGPEMEMQGLQTVAKMKDLAVTGFWEVAKRYSYFRNLLNTCEELLNKHKPDLVIPVDYPGFNIRLAKRAHDRNIPVIWYIAPQLWAWGKDRAKTLAQVADSLLVVFPFEVEYFRQFGIDTHCVGHPLLDQVDLDSTGERDGSVLILPGSRTHEVKKHVPILRDTLRLLRKRGIESTVVAKAGNVPLEALQPLVDEGALISTSSRETMCTASAGMIKAGTSTLEAAVLGLPSATFYRTSWISYIMGKRLITVNSVTMANLLLNRNVINEYIQNDAQPDKLAAEIETLLGNEKRRTELRHVTEEVRSILGGPGAAKRAAEKIVELRRL